MVNVILTAAAFVFEVVKTYIIDLFVTVIINPGQFVHNTVKLAITEPPVLFI